MGLAERLRLFNEKATLLRNRSFFAHLLEEPTRVYLRWDEGNGWASSFLGPEDESIEASVLTIRQFIQNNDPISLQNVSEAYAQTRVPPVIRDEFEAARAEMNESLDRESALSIEEGRQLTNREILKAFIYGGLGHSSEPHYSRYRGLMGSAFADLVRITFVSVLSDFLTGVMTLARINEKALSAISLDSEEVID